MQPSELWRRGVVIPHSSEAADQIAACGVDKSTMVEFLPIVDQALFDQLWCIGLFNDINQACGTHIDDYESEWLPAEHLPSAAKVVARLLNHNPKREVGDFLRRLSLLIGEAAHVNMPLYFVC